MTVNQTDTDALDQLGSAVRDARERLGLSIKQAAPRGGGTARSWSTVEKGGTVKPNTYRNIATAFGISAELITNAAESADALPALVDALTAVVDGQPADGATSSAALDPVDLDDARLLGLLRACVAELEARLGSRSGQLDRIEQALKLEREVRRPQAEQINRQISEQTAKGTP